MTTTIKLTWGEKILPNPAADKGIKFGRVFMGSVSEMSDGSMRFDTIGPTTLTKRIITVSFPFLTEDEFEILDTAFDAYAHQNTELKLEKVETSEGSETTTTLWTYNVYAIHNNWDESQWWSASANAYRNVTLRFDEA